MDPINDMMDMEIQDVIEDLLDRVEATENWEQDLIIMEIQDTQENIWDCD